jgi:hypothetical protein
MPRPDHPDKDIERAVAFAESKGWRHVPSNGHAWGRLFCQSGQRGGCIISVWSTPRNPVQHSRQIVHRVSKCPHQGADHA